MFKQLAAILLLTCTAVCAQTKAPAQKPYVYLPEPKFHIVPRDQVIGMPRPENEPQVIKKWCNTLRGVGAMTIAMDDVLIIVVIDCPEQNTDS